MSNEFSDDEKKAILDDARATISHLVNSGQSDIMRCICCGKSGRIERSGRAWAFKCPSCSWSSAGLGTITADMIPGEKSLTPHEQAARSIASSDAWLWEPDETWQTPEANREELASMIAAALLSARQEALEEAAKAAEGTASDHDADTPGGWCAANAARHAATAIRQLKDKGE